MFQKIFFGKTVWGVVAILGFFLHGCGGDGGFMDHDATSSLVHEGVFLDNAVEGLEYWTPTQSGTTDAAGTFRYMQCENVRFSMGGIDLGEALAKPVMTPIDMVPGAEDETHPTVTNMIRFMQTLDMDGNPDNGITLTMPVMDELRGRMIRFDMDPDEFQQNADVTMFMDTLGMMDPEFEGRTMVPVDQARSHMRGTLMWMMQQPMMGGQSVICSESGDSAPDGMME